MDYPANEIKLINESDIIYIQIDNAKYHWTKESHNFYIE